MMRTLFMPITLVFAILMNLATSASAITPRGSHLTGIIQKVDSQTKEVEMLRDDKGTIITFVWNNLTTFVAPTPNTGVGILKKGAHIEITYRQPFFGKPIVTRVTSSPNAIHKPN